MQDQNSQNEENKNDDMCEIYHPHEDSKELKSIFWLMTNILTFQSSLRFSEIQQGLR